MNNIQAVIYRDGKAIDQHVATPDFTTLRLEGFAVEVYGPRVAYGSRIGARVNWGSRGAQCATDARTYVTLLAAATDLAETLDGWMREGYTAGEAWMGQYGPFTRDEIGADETYEAVIGDLLADEMDEGLDDRYANAFAHGYTQACVDKCVDGAAN